MKGKNRYKASSRIKKRGDTKKTIKNIVRTIVLLAIIAGPAFAMRAEFLQIGKVEVLGAETASVEEIKSESESFFSGTRFYFIPKSNILLLNEDKLAAVILNKFSNLQTVEINKKINNDLEIKIKERKPEFLWCQGGECFNMDSGGLVFEQAIAKGDKMIFRGVISGDPIMKSFATELELQNFLTAIKILEEGGVDVKSVTIEISNKAVFDTNLGDIFLNPEENLSAPAQNALVLINDLKSKDPLIKFNYIDARFGNKVFYK